MRRALSSVLLAALASLLLAACYPEYNWRVVDVADGRAQVLFPARVQTHERQFEWEGQPRVFTMTSAEVGKSTFAAGHMLLSQAERNDSAMVQRWADRLVRGWYANYQVPEPAVLPALGQDVLIEADRDGQSIRLLGRVQVIHGALVDVIAVGPADALSLERAREFVGSLKPAE